MKIEINEEMFLTRKFTLINNNKSSTLSGKDRDVIIEKGQIILKVEDIDNIKTNFFNYFILFIIKVIFSPLILLYCVFGDINLFVLHPYLYFYSCIIENDNELILKFQSHLLKHIEKWNIGIFQNGVEINKDLIIYSNHRVINKDLKNKVINLCALITPYYLFFVLISILNINNFNIVLISLGIIIFLIIITILLIKGLLNKKKEIIKDQKLNSNVSFRF